MMTIQAGTHRVQVDDEHYESALEAGPWHAILMNPGHGAAQGKLYAARCGRKQDGKPNTYLARYLADLAGLPAGGIRFRNGDSLDCRIANLEVLPRKRGSRRPRNRAPFQPAGVTRHRLGTERPPNAYHIALGDGTVAGVGVRQPDGSWAAWRGLEARDGQPDARGDWRTVVAEIVTRRVSASDSAQVAEMAVAA